MKHCFKPLGAFCPIVSISKRPKSLESAKDLMSLFSIPLIELAKHSSQTPKTNCKMLKTSYSFGFLFFSPKSPQSMTHSQCFFSVLFLPRVTEKGREDATLRCSNFQEFRSAWRLPKACELLLLKNLVVQLIRWSPSHKNPRPNWSFIHQKCQLGRMVMLAPERSTGEKTEWSAWWIMMLGHFVSNCVLFSDVV